MANAATGATQIVIAFSPTDEQIAEELDSQHYRSYIRRTRAGPISAGDEWNEFISCGCGATRDVSLRVESIYGGEQIDNETEIVFEPAST
jgi:hypothetical protein